LAGDIWIVPDWGYTCRVVSTVEGDACEGINWRLIDDPQGIERLWSADAALVLDPILPVFQLSTGELTRTANWPDVLERLWVVSAVADESRGVYYISGQRLEEEAESLQVAIVRLVAENGSMSRPFELALACPDDASPPPRCDEPDLGYADQHDVIFVVRRDTWTIEVRDGATYDRLGEIVMEGHPDYWLYSRIVVDETLGRAFVVFSSASRYDPAMDSYAPIEGTPVVEIRLPPP
jgi:hypothetical protein